MCVQQKKPASLSLAQHDHFRAQSGRKIFKSHKNITLAPPGHVSVVFSSLAGFHLPYTSCSHLMSPSPYPCWFSISPPLLVTLPTQKKGFAKTTPPPPPTPPIVALQIPSLSFRNCFTVASIVWAKRESWERGERREENVERVENVPSLFFGLEASTHIRVWKFRFSFLLFLRAFSFWSSHSLSSIMASPSIVYLPQGDYTATSCEAKLPGAVASHANQTQKCVALLEL